MLASPERRVFEDYAFGHSDKQMNFAQESQDVAQTAPTTRRSTVYHHRVRSC
jgi:hypothetical protein